MAKLRTLMLIPLAYMGLSISNCGPLSIRSSNQTTQDTVRKGNDPYDPVIPPQPMVAVPLTEAPPHPSSSASLPTRPLGSR